jgi:cellulose synthase/poly-beta-1,6-N-acetylglucosamine synthase-like glycosyltransferase
MAFYARALWCGRRPGAATILAIFAAEERMSRISVVIPTLTGIESRLLDALKDQTWVPDEIEVVRGVQPNGRARNIGISRTSGDILVLIDDDALPAQNQMIEQLASPLLSDMRIGATGASRLIPPNSGRFQRWTANQVSRIENPVVHVPRETVPDQTQYFYTDITTTCCALRRTVFCKIGEFDEELIQGVDTEFFIRMSRAGYRLRLVPDVWVYHPAPANLRALLRKHFWYGFGHAQQVAREAARARGPEGWPLLYALFRSIVLLPHIFMPYSYAEPIWRPGFKPLKALASYASALGYTWGRVRIRGRHDSSKKYAPEDG